MSTIGQPLLRVFGRQSFSKFVGELLGGGDAAASRAWRRVFGDEQLRLAAAAAVVQHTLSNATEDEKRRVATLLEELIDAGGAASGLWLLRRVATELFTCQEAGDHHCWAW